MRSETCALALACVLAAGTVQSQPASAPTREQVAREVEQLRQDPDLAGTHKQKTLRFKDDEKKEAKPKAEKNEPFLAWLRGFTKWITEAGRVVVWALAALAVLLVVIGLRHWVRVRAGAVKGTSAGPMPSHVRDLDIRPESLPLDIGAAAAALWRQGQHRAALSLLYRGALSRLVHQHAVPIRAASTEGECVILAAQRVAPGRSAYFGRLVQAWQLAVYGARLPDDASIVALCRDFDLQLGNTPARSAGTAA